MFKKTKQNVIQENSLWSNGFHVLRYFSLFCFQIIVKKRKENVKHLCRQILSDRYQNNRGLLLSCLELLKMTGKFGLPSTSTHA